MLTYINIRPCTPPAGGPPRLPGGIIVTTIMITVIITIMITRTIDHIIIDKHKHIIIIIIIITTNITIEAPYGRHAVPAHLVSGSD